MATSESRRGLLIVGAFVALGVGVALFYLFVIQPGRDREAARGQIREWEARWDSARACLLGKEPLAADVADAITARELIAGTTEAAMGECNKPVNRLTRPPGNDSGVPEVESAWRMLEQAGTKVAQAYAIHRERPLGDNPLPAALGELATAHALLRSTAGMGPPPRGNAPEATVLSPQPIMLDGSPVSDVGGISVAGILRGRANVKDKGPYDVTWTADKGLSGAPGATGVRSIPDHTWGLEALIADDDSSTLVAGDNEVTVDTAKSAITPLLALGDGPQRFAVYSVRGRVHVARSADGGSRWTAEPVPGYGDVAFTATPTGDRLDLAWTDEKLGTDSLLVMSLVPAQHAAGPLPAPTRLPAQELATWCTGGALGLVGATAAGYVVFPGGKSPGFALELKQPRPLQCNAERLILRGGTAQSTDAIDHACTTTGCAALPSTGRERMLGLVGEAVYRADSRGNMVAVWRDSEPVALYRIPAPREVYGIADIGGKPILLLLDQDKLALEQAPLPR
jgi:hypothetical protein